MDFLSDACPEYSLSLRIVRIEIAQGVYENLITNLPDIEFDMDELKEIYKNAKKLAKTYYVTKGKTKISFLIKDDKVSEINYLYTGKF